MRSTIIITPLAGLLSSITTIGNVVFPLLVLRSQVVEGFTPVCTGRFPTTTTQLRSSTNTRRTNSSNNSNNKKQQRRGGQHNNSDTRKHQNKRRSIPRSKTIRVAVDTQMAPPLLATSSSQQTQSERLSSTIIPDTCPHFDVCAGCTTLGSVADTHIIDAAERYFAAERYDGAAARTATSTAAFPVSIPSPLTQWRTQAKLVASNKSTSKWSRNNSGCVFGLYRKGSHTVVPIPQCVVHHPAINEALQVLEEATAAARIAAYDSNNNSGGDGDLRYVQLQVERWTQKVCLTLVWNAPALKACQPGLSRLVKELQSSSSSSSSIWHSIWCHCNDSLGNAIFSRSPSSWHRLVGPEYLREPIPVAANNVSNQQKGSASSSSSSSVGWLYFSPKVFRQGNLDGFDRLALDVAKAVPDESKVCELYAGVGVLGLTALAYHHTTQPHRPLQWVRCSDENPSNPRAFQMAVASLPAEMVSRSKQRSELDVEGKTLREIAQLMDAGARTGGGGGGGQTVQKTSYMAASAWRAIQSGQALGANVLIVDPPRKGLDAEILDELCKPFNSKQPYVEDATLLALDDDQVNWLNDVQTLIYVSCGFDALARDCDRLLSRGGGWTLESSKGYILFPGSDHVESLAIFKRK